MKNQYFGDRTDYIKHSLLRHLPLDEIGLAVHWTRTLDDSSTDGKHIAYLEKSDEWRHYDPLLFDKIKERIVDNDRRLDHFEEFGLIQGATFCYDEWTASPEQRKHSNQSFICKLKKEQLVFYDPDNGLETKNTNPKGRNSHKYVYFDDLAFAWQGQHSILLYQHFPRVSREEYLGTLMYRISNRLGCQEKIIAVSTSFAAFLLIPQERHAETLRTALMSFAVKWSPHTSLYFEQASPLGRPKKIPVVSKNVQIELPL
jgi:hypothetical protein